MKLDSKETINRLVIYFFYDADGIVDRYVPYMLEDINKNCSELFVVCNGKLTPEGRKIFLGLTPNLMVRENVGFDVWAYKEALEHYGWDRLAEFDEIVMMNHTIMGPVYPFSEMFAEMNQRDLDFWGITKFHKVMENPFRTEYGYLPEHIQSHFIAVRNSMIQSQEFHRYWKERPEIKSYADAIGKHESIFTKTFHDFGFTWDCYVDPKGAKEFTHHPIMMMPTTLIRDSRCPIFKRRSFFGDYYDALAYSTGNEGKELLEYLKKYTNYDISMIWENILRTNHLSDIKKRLCTNFVLPKYVSVSNTKNKNVQIALVMHLYFEDLIDYCYQYACSMPKDSDIYITTDTEGKKKKIEDRFSIGEWHSVKIILIENRGRDVSALLIGVAPYLSNYDYVCFVHDKKVSQLNYGVKGYSFSEKCFQNLIGTSTLVSNIISLFESEPNLGILCPPPPNHADYYITVGCEWGPNFDITKQLAKKLKLSVPISNEKEPIAPLGTMFWFRPAALKKLFDYKWKYSDFPEEPNKIDGTILHAVERIYPFVAQDTGFYSAWVLSDDYADTELNNLHFMLRNINVVSFLLCGLNDHAKLIYSMLGLCELQNSEDYMRAVTKKYIKSKIPKPIWSALRKAYHFLGGKKWIG